MKRQIIPSLVIREMQIKDKIICHIHQNDKNVNLSQGCREIRILLTLLVEL